MCSNQIKMIDKSLHFCYSKYYRNIATEVDRHGGQRDNLNSTAQHSTAQHSTAQHSTLTAPFFRLFVFIKGNG